MGMALTRNSGMQARVHAQQGCDGVGRSVERLMPRTGGKMPPKGKNSGGNTSSMEYSPAARRRAKRKNDRLQRKFDRLAGPVTVRNVSDTEK
jgi:hypothetical protein